MQVGPGGVGGGGDHAAAACRIPVLRAGRLVPRMLWAAVMIGLPMPLLYEPSASLVGTLVVPYLFAQIPATALAAGVYGVLEGWLAVAGSRDWWPMRPPPTARRSPRTS